MSSKLRTANAEPELEATLDMSPMIDMVFLLLLFFLVNATAIIVQTDPDVKIPIAEKGRPQEDGRGRIVVNVHQDGTFTTENLQVLLDEAAIEDMVNKKREKIEMLGITPKLHLRGDKEAIFKFSRTAIKAAARAKVDQVVFSVYTRPK